jgi:phosphotransferase system enzyme I (PtsI)
MPGKDSIRDSERGTRHTKACRLYSGVPASPGVGIGSIVVVESGDMAITERPIPKSKTESEVERFLTAIGQVRKNLTELRENLKRELGEDHSKIFDAHLMILKDEDAIEATLDGIRTQRRNAEFVYSKVVSSFIDRMELAEFEHLRERSVDLRDVRGRVIRRLLNRDRPFVASLKKPCILICQSLVPSDVAQMTSDTVLGIATDLGSRTSHVTIMARSRGIPAVVGLQEISREAHAGETGVVDGNKGVVVLCPDRKSLREFRGRQRKFVQFEKELDNLKDLTAVTLDGRKIDLAANIEFPDEIEQAIRRGARGIGLYRTEFFYLSSSHLPNEEEQLSAYKTVAERMAPDPVIIRTVDLGGDKFASYLGTPRERNPFFGWRGIRFSLDRQEVFKTQLRAIYRASVRGNVKIMFPMISSTDELRDAKALCEAVRDELSAEGKPFDAEAEIGIMVETPAAVMIADTLARESDFFSIGTNDLIQYTLAVDRGNARIAHLYEPLHPAVLRAIHRVVRAGHSQNIPVGICGEMAADPISAAILIGLGLDELSTSPYLLPEIKTLTRSITFSEAKEIAAMCLTLSTAAEISRFVASKLEGKIPEILLP